jgi:hypothetical protein
MIANGMPSLRYTLQEIWMLYGKLSEHKKGSPGLMTCEKVEQLRRVCSMWSVVKRQSGHGFCRSDVRNTPEEVSHGPSIYSAHKLATVLRDHTLAALSTLRGDPLHPQARLLRNTPEACSNI